ncbi:MAG: HAD-IB family hydrolase [Desulfobacteraceae bacterium]|nr:HAD-IB family hydrolase [Desulfobacteraceae bacterium]
MELALFDFNGTVSRRQILVDFIRYSVHPVRVIAGVLFLWPVLILYLLNLISNRAAKEICFTCFFKGKTEGDFRKAATAFSKNKLEGTLDKNALEKIRWHKSRNHTVVIVSGSIDGLLDEWCQENGLDLIANTLEIKKGRITGKISSVNCWGKGKARRIKENYKLERFSRIYAYGNTGGDIDMLNMANERYMNRF